MPTSAQYSASEGGRVRRGNILESTNKAKVIAMDRNKASNGLGACDLKNRMIE